MIKFHSACLIVLVCVVEEEDEEDKFKGKFYMVPRSPFPVPLLFLGIQEIQHKSKSWIVGRGKGEGGREKWAGKKC